jgi:hypothetical protein
MIDGVRRSRASAFSLLLFGALTMTAPARCDSYSITITELSAYSFSVNSNVPGASLVGTFTMHDGYSTPDANLNVPNGQAADTGAVPGYWAMALGNGSYTSDDNVTNVVNWQEPENPSLYDAFDVDGPGHSFLFGSDLSVPSFGYSATNSGACFDAAGYNADCPIYTYGTVLTLPYNLIANGSRDQGTVQISFVDQSSEVTPEPSYVAVLGLIVLALHRKVCRRA